MGVLEFIRAGFEVLVLTIIFYQIYRVYKDSPAATIFIGLILLLILGSVLIELIGAGVLNHLVTVFFAGPGLILVVLFQPEIRSVLSKFSRKLMGGRLWGRSDEENEGFIEQVKTAVQYMASRRVGALLVFRRNNRLDEIEHFAAGTEVDAVFSPALVETIFYSGTPLHDGAMIIENERITYAGAILPVSERAPIDATMGLRHRAAMGIAEKSDAVVVVVSEEKGRVSLVCGPMIQTDLSMDMLGTRLTQLLYDHVDKKQANQIPQD